MPTPDETSTGFEVDRHVDDQPPRDDLLDPEDIEPERTSELAQESGVLPPTDELPETQGTNTLDAPHETEDATSGERLSDEELEGEPDDGGW
jgi:hypothetical protein